MNIIKSTDETYIAAKAILEGQLNEASGSVFIVNGLVAYEGGRVLGVYTTKSAAEKALAEYQAQVAAEKKNNKYANTDWDDYEIEEKPLNASMILY